MELQLKNVTHFYGKKEALSDVNLILEKGVYGLLGPNGAGKTTLIHIIVRLLNPSSGNVVFCGKTIAEYGAEYFDYIGFLPQYPKFYPSYTALEFLQYMAICKGLPKKKADERINELFALVNLSEEKHKRVGAYSGGMRQRLGIAQALLNDPAILILDEPTAGLDPKERIRFRNLISKISENRIVLLATHIVSDVENIAKEVLLLGGGKLITKATPCQLIDDMRNKVWEYLVPENELDEQLAKENVSNARLTDNLFAVRSISSVKPAADAVLVEPTLEDVYLFTFGGQV